MSTGQFHKLLSPLSLGSGLTLKNRMIKEIGRAHV